MNLHTSLREQLLQVLERTRNEQRERIRNQVERENRDLNNAIQRAMDTVQQIRDVEENLELARQLTQGLGVQLNEDLGDDTVRQDRPRTRRRNLDSYSFTDDDSEMGIGQNLGSGDISLL